MTIGDAEAAVWEDLNLDNFPVFEFRPLYKLIYQTADSYSNTPHARLQAVLDVRRIISANQGIPTTAVSDHGSMTGLADDDHTQYLTNDRHDLLDHSTALGTTSLNDIGNVNVDTAQNGDFLRYNGTVWINDPVNLATDTIGDYVANISAGTGINIANSGGEGATPTISVDLTNTSVTTNSLSTATLFVDSIEIDPSGANSNVQVLRFNGTKFVPGLASTVAALSDLTDVSNAAPSPGNFLNWNGTEWVPATPATGVPSVSDTAPSSPSTGQLWFDSSSTRTFIYYDSHWVEIGATAAPVTTVTKYTAVIGNGTDNSYLVTHNLNTKDVIVDVYDVSTDESVVARIVRTSLDSITVEFSAPAPLNRYKVIIVG